MENHSWQCSYEETQSVQHSRNHSSTTWRSTSSLPKFSVSMVLVVLMSFISLVSASADPEQILYDRRTFADLGARRLMERTAQATGEEQTSTTTTPSSTQATLETSTSATSTVLPQPFDTTLGNNFTSESCPRFFQTFLSDETFRSCYPFSLLLQTSHGFFEAEKNFFQTTRALEAGCKANYEVCNDLMQSLATQLKSTSNCMSDFANENQIVMQAYNGLIAYPVMYQAACLKDDDGDYCFANAINTRANATLADAYSYYLPLGTTMPVGNRPSCSDCLKKTMAIYRSYASNQTQPLSGTYVPAAQQVNMACGPDWVSDVVESTSGASAVGSSAALLLPLLASALMILF